MGLPAVRNDAVGAIVTELAQPGAVDRLAEQARAGSIPVDTETSIIGSIFDIVDAQAKFRERYPHYSGTVFGPKDVAAIDEMSRDPQFAKLRAFIEQSHGDPRVTEMLKEMDEQLAGVLQPAFNRAIAEAAQGAADRLASRDYAAEALGLVKDVGLEGRLSEEQMSALTEFLKADARTGAQSLHDVAASGTIDARTYLKTTLDTIKEGVAALDRLHAKFAE